MKQTIFREQTLLFQKPCTAKDILCVQNPRIGIHGIAGSFTDEALWRFTQEYLTIQESSYTVHELIEAQEVLVQVANRTVDIGIFAFANSGSGGYVASIEAMGRYLYEPIALFTMPITMCLIVHPSITRIDQLSEFRGHPVALSQCRHTLSERWPHIPIHPDSDAMDTALSVKLLSEGKLPTTSAVFASARAANLYSMRILVSGVHHDPNNATFFAVVKHKEYLAR